MPIVQSFLLDRINNTKLLIVELEAAELGLATGEIQSYTLDTGQNRQTVTRMNMTELRKAVESAYNRLATLCARYDGSGTQTARPGW